MDSHGADSGSLYSRSGEECGVEGGGEDAGWGDGGSRRKRQRRFTASERARHRVIEKERREAFGAHLLELAQLIPALRDTKQSLLSKHVIVQESIKHHRTQQEAFRLAERKLLAVTAERDALLLQMRIFGMEHVSGTRNHDTSHVLQEAGPTSITQRPNTICRTLEPLEATAQVPVPPAPELFLHQTPQILPVNLMPIVDMAAGGNPMTGLGEIEDNTDLDVYIRQAIADSMPYYMPPP
ncbi:unnamed protein product [Zymoseptoria tritici ST99CH_1A5]|uniref:BHLH domain-containing protein n=2 Tax=Zymoseptoria tritici TaxID=1047171 RepID=A0A2H1GAS2_ZYMTR|nr:unnamed protein product [Zymoseptoria tritici ST99CH_1E4]SMY23364.1 unnamed protein product [Zymoseptoria tritici ST99CH_1A5]